MRKKDAQAIICLLSLYVVFVPYISYHIIIHKTKNEALITTTIMYHFITGHHMRDMHKYQYTWTNIKLSLEVIEGRNSHIRVVYNCL